MKQKVWSINLLWKCCWKNKSTEIEFSPVYFISTTKTMINQKCDLDKSFQEILYRANNWINKGSGWIVEITESQYIKISTYRSLSGSSYIKLPAELRSQKKGLINIKINDQKLFLWCHVKHINPAKTHSERITQKIKNLVMILTMMKLNFLYQKKISLKLKWKTTFVLMCLVMKTSWPFQSTFQIKKLKIQWICCL